MTTASAQLQAALARTMTVLDESAGMSLSALIRSGFDDPVARKIRKHCATYFGKTAATRKQRLARDNAAARGHTFATLDAIETQIRKLDNPDHAWAMRKELTLVDADVAAIKTRGAELLLRFNKRGVNNPAMSMSARDVPNSTLADMRVRGPQHLTKAAMDRANAYAAAHGIAPAEALLRLAASGEAGHGPRVAPAVIIPIDPTVDVWEKTSLDEVALSMTDGSRMTGRDFAQATLTERGFALLVDPVKKAPLGLYGISGRDWEDDELHEQEDPGARFASTMQRLILRLLNPVCTRPDCGCGADDCEVHHIDPHIRGGPTVLSNLTTLCPFDNGRNDDDPATPRRGRMEKLDGIDYLIPAFGGPPRKNNHPTARGGAAQLYF